MVIAVLLGFLSGLGVGGGSLLMLWLTAVCRMDPATARAVNLLSFLPAAAMACLLRRKELEIRTLWPAMVTGCLSAFLCSRLQVNPTLLRKAFAVLMLITGLREITKKERP